MRLTGFWLDKATNNENKKNSQFAVLCYKVAELYLPFISTLPKAQFFCQMVVIFCTHTLSFLAACQVSHFEAAGIDGIFITSNPFVIMGRVTAGMRNAKLCQWGSPLS